jgi:hypothetical protein
MYLGHGTGLEQDPTNSVTRLRKLNPLRRRRRRADCVRTSTVTCGDLGMVTSQKMKAPAKKVMMVKKMPIQMRQQRESRFFFSPSMPSSSSRMVPGAQGR